MNKNNNNMQNFFEKQAIFLIKEIEKLHHTSSKVVGSASFEQELMYEKIRIVKNWMHFCFNVGSVTTLAIYWAIYFILSLFN